MLLPLNDNYKNLIFSDKILLHNVLDKKHYEVFKYSRSKNYFSFIKTCLDKKVEITSVNNLIDEIYEFGIDICNNCNDDNVLEFITIVQDIGEFLKEIKSPKAFDFAKRLKELNELKDKFIIKHGIYHKQEVPIDELVIILMMTKFLGMLDF